MAWYVVFRGRKAGVYVDWQACHDQVSGYKNNCYRSYSTRDEAVAAYLAYFGKGEPSTSRALGEADMYALPPPVAELGREGLGEKVSGAPREAAPATPDNLLVVFIMVAIFLVLCSYVMK